MATDPRALFDCYDIDSNGTIGLEEFRLMLPQLGIHVSPAKSLGFFRHYDRDNSGGITYDEFLALLFACNSNQNPAGFVPSERLAPKDAFCIFDQDKSGAIDEDEFFYLLQYMGIDTDEATREKLFTKYDKDRDGTIDYFEFKQVWLYLTDARRELEERDVEVPKFASKTRLLQLLDQVLLEEEEMEAEAFRYADAWRKRQQDEQRRQQEMSVAEEGLCRALDTLGQVILLGGGTFNQFAGDNSLAQAMKFSGRIDNECEQSHVPQEWLKMLQSLWKRRLLQTKRYQGLSICQSTFALWGRRPTQIALSDSSAFCLFSDGDLHAWGGTETWWAKHQQEEAHSAGAADLTPRSRALLEVPSTQSRGGDDATAQQLNGMSSVCRTFLDDAKGTGPEAMRAGLEYYQCWTPPTTTDDSQLHYLSLLEQIDASRIKQSIELRGKPCDNFSRVDMIGLLARDIELEKRVLGEAGHLKLREIDREIGQLKKRRKTKLVKRLSLQFTQVWRGSLEEAQRLAMQEEASQRLTAKQRLIDLLVQTLEKWSSGSGTYPKYSSVVAGSAHAGVITTRAIDSSDEDIPLSSSTLYTWGVTPAGRLGTKSCEWPKSVDGDGAFSKMRVQGLDNVVDASFGSSHCAAVVDQGSLYVWGSSTSGKLGLDRLADQECYVTSPRPLRLPVKGTNGMIRRVSCGANHSACISSRGQLYVWGSAAGGRLGLGRNKNIMEQHTPYLIESLLPETITDVSCGGLQTLASTAIVTTVNEKGRKEVSGGKLYCAGPSNCLGVYCPEFTHFPLLGLSGGDTCKSALAERIIRIRQLSAGHCHQAVVSMENELHCWGRNDNGCCGQDPRSQNFIDRPTLVPSLYKKATNLSRCKPCRQSSIYDNHVSQNAVDGDIDGCSDSYSQTQIDPQPFWEVDLQDLCSITSIKVWSSIEASPSSKDSDSLIQNLVPFRIIVSKDPLNDNAKGLQDAPDESILCHEVTKGAQEFEWILPFDSVCRYVRIQKNGYESLRLCQVEVLGYHDSDRVMSPILSATAGRDITGVVLSSVSPDNGQIVRAFNTVVAVK